MIPGRPPHLRVAITAHGWGHATQAGAVIRALRRKLPRLRISVQATLPEAFVTATLGGPVERIAEAADPGLVMRDAFSVDLEASAAAYRDLHDRFEERTAALAARLGTDGVDLLLADVPYLPLAAAKLAGIPAVALCSLNWADVYAHYLGDRPEAQAIAETIRACYRAADLFLIPEPGMPMPWLDNARRIGPCAALGRDRRDELDRRLGLAPGTRLVVVAMGGVAWANDYSAWPPASGTHWIVQSASPLPPRADMTRLADLGIGTADLLASADALVGKLGYSLPTEAACNGAPMLYVARHDWPETPHIAAWMVRHAAAAEVPLAAVRRGELRAPLDRLLAAARPPRPAPDGGDEAAAILADLLP